MRFHTRKPPSWPDKILKYIVPVFVIFIFFIPILMFMNASRRFDEYWKLTIDGTRVLGTITTKTGTGSKSPYYILTYSYQLPDGSRRTGRQRTIDKIGWTNVQVGRQIPILYLPNDPSISQLEHSTVGAEAEVMLKFSKVLMVVFPVVGGILIFRKRVNLRAIRYRKES